MVPMTRLTSVHGSFPAHVLAARLQSDGFDVELRGAVDGPYAVTVGDLARVDVFVPDDQVAEASLVLLESEVEAALDDEVDGPRRVPWGRRVFVVAVMAAAVWPILHYALATG